MLKDGAVQAGLWDIPIVSNFDLPFLPILPGITSVVTNSTLISIGLFSLLSNLPEE